ncbi:MAG: ThuA domain-containing protein [Prolixibacteraceae bacterium]
MKYLSRRQFVLTTMAAGAATVVLPTQLLAGTDEKATPSLKGKKVLYVYGGWAGHEPKQSVDLFVPWLRLEGAEVTVSDTLDSYLDEKLMASLDLIIQIWTMGTITKDQEAMLVKTVKNGTGLAGWHGGTGDSFRNNVEYQFMVGGQWVAHPGGVIDYMVNVTNHKDTVTKGLNDFNMHSEQYYVHVDPNVKVLATTKFSGENAFWIEGCIIPVVWKKYYGNGRVFYSSLGHVMTDYNVPEALEIQKRGIRWASESKYFDKEEWINPIYG